MAIVQFSVAVRNARLDAIETTIGATARLHIYTGALPADCAASPTGTKVVEIVCPTNWLNDASSGQKTLAGSWTVAAVASGTAGYYRMYDSTNSICGEQGDITVTGGGGAMTLDNLSIAIGQTVTVTTKTLTDGNA